ncbi:MAG: cell division topological specificity factor MinE [Clostridia bacterium]|jgi:cell division topological specificity factor|nr:cell division topological specificity factor MinE [Clostridia bacterium]MDD4571954.1 cell division topological specificity factor MinE [Clostridia bacterium]
MAFSDMINKFFGKDQVANSKDVAKERLRLVLVHDRANALPEDVLLALREEMIKVITKYMDIDEGALDVGLTKSDTEIALVANIPVVRIKRNVG